MAVGSSLPHCLVFDSGMGGLTVVEALRQLGFQGRVSYAADTGFFPYGNKSDAALTKRVPRFADALMRAASPDIFVIACNTASTLALEIVRAVLPVPVVGTVPAIKPAASLTRTGTVGVLATPGTLRRAYTDALIHEFARHLTVLTHGSVLLVEQAELEAAGEPVDEAILQAELHALLDQPGGEQMDTIVLACTHFPILRQRLEAIAPGDIRFIDSGEAIARRTLSLLSQMSDTAPSANFEADRLFLSRSQTPTGRLEKVARSYGFREKMVLDVD